MAPRSPRALSRFRFPGLLWLALLPILAACGAASAPALPLEPYTDPAGRFTFAFPEGWQTSTDETTRVLTLTPAAEDLGQTGLRVLVFSAPTQSLDPQEHIAEAKALFEPFLSQYLDDTWEVVNEGETKIDRYPAMLLDFAKPYQQDYLAGRVVIAAMPAYALVFLGTGQNDAWQNFLPTFRAMLKEFHLLSAQEEPLLP